MPRKRYPSDEERLKVKPHVRVYHSIRNPDDAGQLAVFGDPELRGVWLGLVLIAARAYAGDTGDRVLLAPGDVEWATGRRMRKHGNRLVRRVCELMGWECEEVEVEPDSSAPDAEVGAKSARRERDASSTPASTLSVHVRNLSENQGWDSAARGALRSQSQIPSADLQTPERGAESSGQKPPTLKRLQLADLQDLDRFGMLYRQAVEHGLVADNTRGLLEWYTRRFHALRCGRDPVRLFVSNLRKRIDFASNADEDAARAALRQLQPPPPPDHAVQQLGLNLDGIGRGGR